jgi:hypothetical protein
VVDGLLDRGAVPEAGRGDPPALVPAHDQDGAAEPRLGPGLDRGHGLGAGHAPDVDPGDGHAGEDPARRGTDPGGGGDAHDGQQQHGQADDHGDTLPAGQPGGAPPVR